MALHAVSLLISRQLRVDIERFAAQADLHVVPPLCPITVGPHDFHLRRMDRRAATSTRSASRAAGSSATKGTPSWLPLPKRRPRSDPERRRRPATAPRIGLCACAGTGLRRPELGRDLDARRTARSDRPKGRPDV